MGYVLKNESEEEKFSLGIASTDEKRTVKPTPKGKKEVSSMVNNRENTNKNLSIDKKLSLILEKQTEIEKRIDKLENNHLSNLATKDDIKNLKKKRKKSGRPPTFKKEDVPIIIEYIKKKEFVLTPQLKDNFRNLEKTTYFKYLYQHCKKNDIPLVGIKISGLKSGRPPTLLFVIDNWFKAFLKTKKKDIETRRVFKYDVFKINPERKKELEKIIKNHELLSRIFLVLDGSSLVKIKKLSRVRKYF